MKKLKKEENCTLNDKNDIKWGNHIRSLFSEIADSMKNQSKVASNIVINNNKEKSTYLNLKNNNLLKLENKSSFKEPINNNKTGNNSKKSFVVSCIMERPCFLRTDRLYKIIHSYADNNKLIQKTFSTSLLGKEKEIKYSLRRSCNKNRLLNNASSPMKNNKNKISNQFAETTTSINFEKIIAQIQEQEKMEQQNNYLRTVLRNEKKSKTIPVQMKLKFVNESNLVMDNKVDKILTIDEESVHIYPLENKETDKNNSLLFKTEAVKKDNFNYLNEHEIMQTNESNRLKNTNSNIDKVVQSEKSEYTNEKLKQLENELNDIDSSGKFSSEKEIYLNSSSNDEQLLNKKSGNIKEGEDVNYDNYKNVQENIEVVTNKKENNLNEENLKKEITSINGEMRKIRCSDENHLNSSYINHSFDNKINDLIETNSANKINLAEDKNLSQDVTFENIKEIEDELESGLGKINSLNFEDEEKKKNEFNESIYNDFINNDEEIPEEN